MRLASNELDFDSPSVLRTLRLTAMSLSAAGRASSSRSMLSRGLSIPSMAYGSSLKVADWLDPSLWLFECENEGRNMSIVSVSGCHSTRNAPLTFVVPEPLRLNELENELPCPAVRKFSLFDFDCESVPLYE